MKIIFLLTFLLLFNSCMTGRDKAAFLGFMSGGASGSYLGEKVDAQQEGSIIGMTVGLFLGYVLSKSSETPKIEVPKQEEIVVVIEPPKEKTIEEKMEELIKAPTESTTTKKTVDFSSIKFEPAKAKLTIASKEILDKIAKVLKSYPDIRILISAHTDSKGSAYYNLVLSRKRAKSVKDYLLLQGVNSNMLTTKGFGETKPIATNETEEGRAKNRRVEFNVINRNNDKKNNKKKR